MKNQPMYRGAILLALILSLLILGCQKELKAPNGLSFSVVKNYHHWPLISFSYRQDLQELHLILGNATAFEDFLHGIPDNGHPFTDGAVLVRLVYPARANPSFGQDLEPGRLKRLDYMIKDAERFKNTKGWGYASFAYLSQEKRFKPLGSSADFFRNCIQCHEKARKRDYVFTSYSPKGPR